LKGTELRETPRTSATVKADLMLATEALKMVREKIEKCEKKLASLKEREVSLAGSSFGRDRGGKINSLRSELQASERYESDLQKPIVVWAKPPSYDNGEYRVSRVTPKRIFVRRTGSTHETQYERDGTPVSKGYNDPRIDLIATLGEV
jgi:hypothetical protein